MTKMYGVDVGDDQIALNCIVIVAQLCKYTKIH